MDIYWVKDGRRSGPATVPDVISMVHGGDLSPETLGWHAGCRGWMPLRDLPALEDFLKEPQAETPAQEELPPVPPLEDCAAASTSEPAEAESAEHVRVWLPSPSTRLMARGVDVVLYLGAVYAAIYLRQLPFSPYLMPDSPFLWLGFVAVEAALITFFGTTPGKSFFGIRVIAFREGATEEMGFWRALGRSLMVFVGGMGMMISFLPMVMSGLSWWTLRSHGITYWDARMCTFPAQKFPTGSMRRILAALMIFLCLQMIGFCMTPWAPSMVDFISERSPEQGDMLRRLMPDGVLPGAPEAGDEMPRERARTEN